MSLCVVQDVHEDTQGQEAVRKDIALDHKECMKNRELIGGCLDEFRRCWRRKCNTLQISNIFEVYVSECMVSGNAIGRVTHDQLLQ